MSKKKLTEITGKVEKTQPTTLEQVWGYTGLSKYKTLDEEVYVNSLKDMNLSDLQSHAVTIGIIPTDEREMLTKKLLKEFRLFTASFKMPRQEKVAPKTPSKEALKILSEGR